MLEEILKKKKKEMKPKEEEIEEEEMQEEEEEMEEEIEESKPMSDRETLESMITEPGEEEGVDFGTVELMVDGNPMSGAALVDFVLANQDKIRAMDSE